MIVRKAMTTARTEGCTVGQLSRVLHYAGTSSLGEAFTMYAEYFKVFQEYCNNLDYARNRVDACKKHEVFKRAFKQCQEDPRSKGMDLHNWLQSELRPRPRARPFRGCPRPDLHGVACQGQISI